MLNYITLMQIVGCILVIFGHSYPFITDIPECLSKIQLFIYSFHMPLFVFCSGYLFKYTKQSEKNSFIEFSAKRAKRILVPYFVFSVLGIVPKVLFTQYLNDTFSFNFSQIMQAFLIPRNNIWGHFWFLPMIYIIGLIGYGIDSIATLFITADNKVTWGGIVIVSFALSFLQFDAGKWFGINDVMLYFWFFAVGVLTAGIRQEKLKHRFLMGSVLTAVSVIVFVVSSKIRLYPVKLLNKLIGIAMVYGILFLCVAVSEMVCIRGNSPLKQTYTMFILSWPCQLTCEIILERILHMPIYITFPVEFFVGLFITMLLIKLIDCFERKTKTRVLSFCLGK